MTAIFAEPRYFPQGAVRQSDNSVVWTVWAPNAPDLMLVTWRGEDRQEFAPLRADGGYLTHRLPDVEDGLRYAWALADGRELPDPASRWQPEGVHRPSAVFSPNSFAWTDQNWKGLTLDDLVLYELHVGAFTPDGTFDAAIARLPELRELGVTAIELMPVAQFPGERNWGYDGVYPFAAQDTYGGPHGLQRLVDAAHRVGLGVFLDVVYNHFGPEGNYLSQFGPYFTDRYFTPWGQALNFDGPDCGPVRQFVIDNANMWIRDFHIDGLRVDAVHAIFDLGARHILAEMRESVIQAARQVGRTALVIAESNQNDPRLLHPEAQGGYGLDGVWSDDFHHSVHSLLTRERDGYYEDFGPAELLAKAYNRGFVYDGCYSSFRRRRHGGPVGDLERERFVVCTQNHDQVGNRAHGERLSQLLPPEALRLAAGLLLLTPDTPLLFMGQEYAERRPFPFFCSFSDPDLIEAVRRGRREEFAAMAFHWGNTVPDPDDIATYSSAKLTWTWEHDESARGIRQLYADLLAARRDWPALRDRRNSSAEVVAAPGDPPAPAGLLVLRRGLALTALANLSAAPRPMPAGLVAAHWVERLSTANARYGGPRRARDDPRGPLAPYELRTYSAEAAR